jgi:hypothetical protein
MTGNPGRPLQDPSDAKRLRAMEDEHRRLKQREEKQALEKEVNEIISADEAEFQRGVSEALHSLHDDLGDTLAQVKVLGYKVENLESSFKHYFWGLIIVLIIIFYNIFS